MCSETVPPLGSRSMPCSSWLSACPGSRSALGKTRTCDTRFGGRPSYALAWIALMPSASDPLVTALRATVADVAYRPCRLCGERAPGDRDHAVPEVGERCPAGRADLSD